MPFKRFRRGRRIMRRRPMRPQRRYNTLGAVRFLARKAARGVRYIRGLVNSEMFKYDQSQTANSVTQAGTVLALTSIAQGDGDGNRTGNSIFVRSINFKGTLTYNTMGNNEQFVRIILFEDTQQISDTSPSLADVLEAGTTFSHLNSNTVGRFKILYNHVFALSQNRPGIPFEINKSMRHHVRYNGTAGTDIQRGALYMMWLSDSSSNYPQLNYETRTSYHDN